MPGAATYVSWRQGEPYELAYSFEPTHEGHPCHTDPCVVCGQPIGNGDRVRLRVRLRVFELDPEDSYKYKLGKWFNPPADLLHGKCATTPATIKKDHPVYVARDDV